MPTERRLRAWREIAQRLAKEQGATKACDLCKRPIKNGWNHGQVGLRSAKAWRSPERVRILCHSCWLALSAMLDEMEMLGARDHLPPEDYVDVEDDELAAIKEQAAAQERKQE